VLHRTPWPQLIHPNDVAMLRCWDDELRSRGSAAPVRARIRTRDGSYRFIEFGVGTTSDAEDDLMVCSAHVVEAGDDGEQL
jgi:PAS domain-containing protein